MPGLWEKSRNVCNGRVSTQDVMPEHCCTCQPCHAHLRVAGCPVSGQAGALMTRVGAWGLTAQPTVFFGLMSMAAQ